ncbi:L,D-transpeptidase [Nocardioides sp.]|uniref:L,D-transpeptidase n=1 Tax=Nocardioides sp. TaxID=35761 RepID=UPI0037850179
MSKHRAEVRPRYGRFAALLAALAVTVVAVLGGAGLLPTATGSDPDPAAAAPAALGGSSDALPAESPAASATPTPPTSSGQGASATALESSQLPSQEPPLPAGSGEGKRVVFSQGEQRVWLVSAKGDVQRTYLVSGSVYDNLDPGTYSVYSRSEQAYGINDSGTMKWFVRFTQGENAAIGFHDIPVADGKPVQTVAQLGTPQSHGCIRQKESDALALWDFAPIGTTVVVTA